MTPVEEIKQKLDLVEVIGEYVQLKPAGGHSFKGVCPFHREKTPSFYVSRDKQLWTCFGCNKGGDLFTFVMEMESTDFGETVRYLGEKAGVEVTRFEKVDTNVRTRLLALLEHAARAYHKSLAESETSQVARDYLKKREIDPELAQKFVLGYAPDRWDGLTSFLKKQGFREQEMIDAGLAIHRQDKVGVYDRFRHRLMFPIFDARGKVVGFAGRLLDEKRDEGKYINTPQTLVYNKSQVLYGLHLAKQAVKNAGYFIIVEGNMDVIASHKAGVEAVVASSGTALTEEQINLMHRFTDTLLVCFDADPAGESAAKRGIDAALVAGMNVRVVTLPTGFKDPDDCVRKDPALWRAAVADATDAMTYYFKKVFAKGLPSSAEDKKKAGALLLPEIARLQDPIERTHWLHELGSRLGVSDAILEETLAHVKKKTTTEKMAVNVPTKSIAPITRDVQLAEAFLMLFFGRPDVRSALTERVRREWLPEAHASLYNLCASLYYEGDVLSTAEGSDHNKKFADLRSKIALEQPTTLSLFDSLSVKGEALYAGVDEKKVHEEMEALIIVFQDHASRATREMVARELRTAEEIGNTDRIQELLKKFNEIA